ncbi:FtsH protease activity modulator HflK [Suttonella ornithocola]|uniref:Protein HflK n=1 Tax=Suttonella ornithocola TaxID=279832 RepID=A0A380MPZ6_9GAMM|nr:FtsH protease activity modulator HflK [Suttonella ornithocola]SUO93387.1 Modulator of FtsH protease HflK [Suttonella ornithocola]
MFLSLTHAITQWRAHRAKANGLAMAQDPWGERPDDKDNKKTENGPPDLDEFFAKLIGKGKKSGGNNQNKGNNPLPSFDFQFNEKVVGIVVAIVIAIWLSSGFYTVNERENGVETLLGKYTNTTHAGLNWNWPAPIGKVEKVDVQSISTMRVGEFKTRKGSVSTQDQRVGQMLTKDENIVEIGVAVQYRISDARAFLFNAADPVEVLRDVVTSAIREVVGANTVDDILKDRRNEWPQQAKQIIIATAQKYGLGIEVIALELQDARVPVEVQDAFEEAVRAREDEERLRLQAEAFANERLPMARGESAQRLQSAKAYAVSVVAKAEAEATRFTDLLAAYQKDKQALRTRLYLDTMSTVYGQNRKIVADKNMRPIISLDGANEEKAQRVAAFEDELTASSIKPMKSEEHSAASNAQRNESHERTDAQETSRDRARLRSR